MWEDCRERGIAALGYWEDRKHRHLIAEDCRKLSQEEYEQIWHQKDPNNSTGRSSLRKVAYEMKAGDVIYVKGHNGLIGRGVITRPYQYDPSILKGTGCKWPHYVTVSWCDNFKPLHVRMPNALTTVYKLEGALLKKIIKLDKTRETFEAPLVTSIVGGRADYSGVKEIGKAACYWTGWRNKWWLYDFIKKGTAFYAYDRSESKLWALCVVTRGGAFEYTNLVDFKKKVKRLIGLTPDLGNYHTPPKKGYGVAICFKGVKEVYVPYYVRRFHQLGWLPINDSQEKRRGVKDLSDLVFTEGSRVQRTHLRVERNREAVNKAKQLWREKGALNCSICGFDFGKTYGARGMGYIEFHHKTPLSALKGVRHTKVSDLIALCSNCHRVIHRHPDDFSIEDLRTALRLKPKRCQA